MPDEQLIAALDVQLQVVLQQRIQRAIESKLPGKRRGAHAIHRHAELAQRAIKRRQDRIDADGTGDRRGAGEDLVGGRRHVISTGSGEVTHRDHDRLAGSLYRRHFPVDLLGREDAAARTVDAQHHGGDVVVVPRFAQQVGRGDAADHAGWLPAIEDFPAGHDHPYPSLRAPAQLLLGRMDARVVAKIDGRISAAGFILADQFLNARGDLVSGLDAGDQPRFQRHTGGIPGIGAQRVDVAIGVLVDDFGGKVARLAHRRLV